MVNIAPFKGFRPKADRVQDIASVPYDVVNSEEARELAKGNELSFLHVIKPEIDLDTSINIYDEIVYQKGADNLRKFVESGWLIQDKPCFYVYAQQMGEHYQIGLVAGASVDDYDSDRIKKHEHTRPDKENDRTKHVDMLNANTGPVFLTYKQKDSIDKIIQSICKEKPTYDFVTKDEVKHIFWVISDEQVITEIEKEFEKIDALYVADGHHRSASGSRVAALRKKANPLHTGNEPYNFFLSVIFPDNQMQIMAYNRVVHTLSGMSPSDFIEKVKEKFEISESVNKIPQKPHHFCMYFEGKWYELKIKDAIVDENDVVQRLDVSILQENILAPLLKIENPRTDKKIRFVGGIRGPEELEKAVNEKGEGVAFSLYPVSIENLIAIADAGEIMPPKSTWFEPKLRSGLIIKPLI